MKTYGSVDVGRMGKWTYGGVGDERIKWKSVYF
jgi:hypothetical protein